MKKENIELLESLIEDRLNKAVNEGDSNAFEEAMKAIDRQLTIDNRKFELEKEEIKQKYDAEKEDSRQQFELTKEENRQQFEIDRDENNQEFELKKDARNKDHELKRDDESRKHELTRDKLNREFELKKLDENHALEKKKMETESKRANMDRLLKIVELGAVVVAAPLIEAGCKKAFAHMLCEFEKDYNFTTTAGKSLSGLFRFRK